MTVSFFGSECKVQMHCHRIACKNRGTKIMWTNFSRDAPAKDVSKPKKKKLAAKKIRFFSVQMHTKANLNDVAKYRGVYYRRINFAGGHCSFSRMLSENSSSYAFQLPSKSTKCRSFSRYYIHWTCKTSHFCWVKLSRGWGFLLSSGQCNQALSHLEVWRGWGGGVIFPTYWAFVHYALVSPPKCPTKCFIFQLKCSIVSQDLLAFPWADGIANCNIDYPDHPHHILDFFLLILNILRGFCSKADKMFKWYHNNVFNSIVFWNTNKKWFFARLQ